MRFKTMHVEPISETQSSVELLFHDGADEATASELVRLRVRVEHGPHSSLAEIQARALRRMRTSLAEETARIESLAGLSGDDHA